MEGGCKCRQTFSRSPATHPPTPRASRFLTGTVRLCGLGAGDPCSKVRLRKWGKKGNLKNPSFLPHFFLPWGGAAHLWQSGYQLVLEMHGVVCVSGGGGHPESNGTWQQGCLWQKDQRESAGGDLGWQG